MNLSCALWGHHVDNRLAAIHDHDRLCRCGEPYLRRDGSLTRVRHTLSCFLGHHTYRPLADRDGCREYVCVQCGHPLVFRDGDDPYRASAGFRKKVRYLCGLFGHRVASVAERNGCIEYACHCGHTFLKEEQEIRTIRHPMICVALGHYVRYVTSRAAYDEFICVNCGHPFCFGRAHGEHREIREIRENGRVYHREIGRSGRSEVLSTGRSRRSGRSEALITREIREAGIIKNARHSPNDEAALTASNTCVPRAHKDLENRTGRGGPTAPTRINRFDRRNRGYFLYCFYTLLTAFS